MGKVTTSVSLRERVDALLKRAGVCEQRVHIEKGDALPGPVWGASHEAADVSVVHAERAQPRHRRGRHAGVLQRALADALPLAEGLRRRGSGRRGGRRAYRRKAGRRLHGGGKVVRWKEKKKRRNTV